MAMTVSVLTYCRQCVLRSAHRFYQTDALPRITVPHRMIQRIEKEKLKIETRKRQEKRTYKGPLVISCKRAQYNHYYGQTYSNFSPEVHLASHGWKHPKSRGDHFTINAFKSNPALDIEGASDTFKGLGINKLLVDALSQTGIESPTNIQSLTIPSLLQRKNLVCAAETGSGKTLAYLLPILECLHQRNGLYGRTEVPNQPHGVVVIPSRELAVQIHEVAEKIGSAIGCRSHVIIGGNRTQRLLRERPQFVSDLLVTTPGVFSKLLTNRIYDMSRLSNIVLDEADTLFDDSFSSKTLHLLRKMNYSCEKLEFGADLDTIGTQLSLVSATMPRSLNTLLKNIVPEGSLEEITTSQLHRLLPHVPQKFVRLGPSQRPDALMKAVKSNVKRGLSTIVFCNKSSTAFYLNHIFKEAEIDHVLLTANIPRTLRLPHLEKFQSGEVKLLISTDLGSRGLDTNKVNNVINFEFPNFMSDYIHRAGRVGRVNSPAGSYVLNFISHKWDVDLLWHIESAARRVTDLHNVNANIKRKLVGHAEKRKMRELAQGQNNKADEDFRK